MDSTERIQILRRNGFGDHLISAMLNAEPADLAAAALDPEFPLTLGETTALGPLTVGLVDIADTITVDVDSEVYVGRGQNEEARVVTPTAWNTPALNLGVGVLFWSLTYDLVTADFDPDDSGDAGMVMIESIDPGMGSLTRRPLEGDFRMMASAAVRDGVAPEKQRWGGQEPALLADITAISPPGPVRIQALGAHMNANWDLMSPPHSPMTFSNLRFAYLGL
jgi:hypothetical protein